MGEPRLAPESARLDRQGGRGVPQPEAKAQRVRRDRRREGDWEVPSRLLRAGAHTTHADNAVAFWSCWSGALLGDMHALVALKQFASVPEFAERAIEVALRRTPGYAAGPWLEELSRDEANVRLVLRGAGIVGDPWFVPGLISMMNLPEMARLAFESFCTITGADPATTPLEAAAPLEFEEADAHPDDLLPWPDVPRVQAWWENNEGRFKSGNRYLLGKPATRDQVEWVLRYGSQLHRRGAALDLAMAAPGQPLFETRAPAARQQQLLGLN